MTHSYEGIMEVYADISFVVDRDDLLKLLEELGLEPDPSLGRQYFPSVPCDGDNASLTVDWATGEVLIEYMNV